MSKTSDDELENGEEIAEEVDASKKKKKSDKPKKEGGLPIVLLAGGALGGIILIIISVIIGTIVANKLFPPQIGLSDANSEHSQADEHSKPKLKGDFPDDDGLESTSSVLLGEDWLTFSSDKMVANVKNSLSTIVVMQVAINYKIYYKEELIAKGFATSGEGKDSHGNPLPPGVDTTSALYQKLKQNVASKINDFIAGYTDVELQAMRAELSKKLREYLKPTFKDFGLVIGEVNIVQFMFTKSQ